MAEEGFLRRWARRKTESRLAEELPEDDASHAPAVQPAVQPMAPATPTDDAAAASAHAPARPLPGMEDVARLTPDADFSAFVARGVDPAVRRGALKKLFADPHFHAMDGLDVYIDDYTKPSPVPAAMLASLTHARRVLQPLLDEQEAAPPKQPGASGEAAVPDANPTDPPPDDTLTPEPQAQPIQEAQPNHSTQETQ